MFATRTTPLAASARPSVNRRSSAKRELRVARDGALGDASSVFATSGFYANAVTKRGDVACGAGARGRVVMAAKVAGYIKLAIEAGKASPAPPIGPALGAKVRARGVIVLSAMTRRRAMTRGRGGRAGARKDVWEDPRMRVCPREEGVEGLHGRARDGARGLRREDIVRGGVFDAWSTRGVWDAMRE